MQARSLLILVLAACGPQLPDEGTTAGDTGSTTTSSATTSATTTTSPTTTTGSSSPTTTTGSSTSATDDSSAASVDPPLKLDLPPRADQSPPPTPPACDPPPDVSPAEHCEVLQHARSWDFMYACLEGADPDACPDAEAATVLDLLSGCSLCTGVDGSAMCGPDPRREDACCYWGFGVIFSCPP